MPLNDRKAGFNLLLVKLEEFLRSPLREEPPGNLSFALAGLQWDAKDWWKQVDESAQQHERRAGSWVHADLHSKEADSFKTLHWYRRAHDL